MMARKGGFIDGGMACLGLAAGLLLGAVYTLTRIKKRGAIRRKDLVAFGAASLEQDMEASIEEAKALAQERRKASD